MNPEASQTPEPIDERLAEKEEQNNAVEHPVNPSVESVGETGGVSSSENYATFEPLISNAEVVDTTVELTENSNGEFVAQSEPENTALGSEIESENHSLYAEAEQRVAELQKAEAALKSEIVKLQASYKNLQAQVSETQTSLGRLVQESLVQLEQRKQTLQISVEQLERRQERIRNEMRTTFAGTSQDLAIRVQGFKDYLTGSLQDLAVAAEQLQLTPSVVEREKPAVKEAKPVESQPGIPQFAQQQFQDTTKQIRRLIDQYRNKPDYYAQRGNYAVP